MLNFQIDLDKTSPREFGRAQGQIFKKEIQSLANIREHLIKDFLKDFTDEKISDLSLGLVQVLKTKFPHFHEEFMGISEESGINPSQLMVLNNYTDMRDFSTHGQDEGCTVFSISREGRYVCGQTWDMHASASPFMMHLSMIKQQKKIEILTLTGCFALSGVNEAGVSVFINNLHCSRTSVGLAWPALVRGMLEKQNATDTTTYLRENLPCSGHNYLIVDSQHSANIETTGQEAETTEEFSKEGHIVHTNHYMGSLKKYEMAHKKSKTTENRQKIAESYLANVESKELTIKGLAQGLYVEGGGGCINVSKPTDPHASMTCGGILYDQPSRKGLIYAGNYSDGDHRDFIF